MTTQSKLAAALEQDMSWFTIAVDNRGEVVILDYATGWAELGVEFYWEDTFSIDPPKHLPVGAYRWTGFTVGSWDEDEHINVTGGEFTPHRPTQARVDAVTQGDRDAAASILAWPFSDQVRRGDNDDHGYVQAFKRHRLAAQPAMDAEAIRDALRDAYMAGATAVHEYWLRNPGEAPRGDPEFGEAAGDYAAAAIRALDLGFSGEGNHG